MEKLLFFGLTDAEFQKIKPVASRLKLHCEQIPVSMYHNTLGAIASGRAVPAGTPVPASLTAALGADAPAGASAVSAACGIPEAGSTPAAVSRDRLLVMCQLPERRMDKLLFELRRIDAPIDYKAVLTPTNAGWTIPRLLMEMHSEKAAYTAKNR